MSSVLPPKDGKIHRTTAFRWALAYMGAFGASILIIFSFIYWKSSGHLDRHMEDLISGDLENIVREYQGDRERFISLINDRIRYDRTGARIYLLAGTDLGRITGNLDAWPKMTRYADGFADFVLPPLVGTKNPEPRHIRSRIVTLPDDLLLLVGFDMDDVDDVKEVYGSAFGWGLVLTVGLGLIGGATLSSGMLRRLEAINRTSRDIMNGDFSQRVPLRGSGDDFDKLAHNLNTMLDQIQKLMDTVKGVSDNIAHDLRTPLARLKSRLELARTIPPSEHDFESWIDGTITNLDSILGMFEALLKIAEVEANRSRDRFTAVDIRRIVEDVAAFYEPLADEKDQRFVVRTDEVPWVSGDRDLLFRAFANLLDNSIKYTPAGGCIEIFLETAALGPQLIVADNGPGVPEEAQTKIFERFFRLEASRSTPGNGLGLSLVAAVVELHRGSLHLQDNRPGLRVILDLPQDNTSVIRRVGPVISAATAA